MNTLTVKKPANITKSEIAAAYNISLRTLKTWMRTADINFIQGSHYVPPKIVDKIVDEFGEPLEWKE